MILFTEFLTDIGLKSNLFMQWGKSLVPWAEGLPSIKLSVLYGFQAVGSFPQCRPLINSTKKKANQISCLLSF